MERHQGVGGRLEPRLLAWGKTPAAIGILCSPQEIEARGERFAHYNFRRWTATWGDNRRYLGNSLGFAVERPSRRQRRLSSRRGRAPARKHAARKRSLPAGSPLH